MKPIEAVARGIEHETIRRQGQGCHLVTGYSDSMAFARAALTALAENITPEMVKEGRKAWLKSVRDYTGVDVSIEAALRAMIAKVLE